MPKPRKIRIENKEDLENKFLKSVELLINVHKHWKIWRDKLDAASRQNLKESNDRISDFLNSLVIIEVNHGEEIKEQGEISGVDDSAK